MRRPGQDFLILRSVPDNFLTTLSKASEVRLNLWVKVSGWTIARHAILSFSAWRMRLTKHAKEIPHVWKHVRVC